MPTEAARPDPDALLANVQRGERGHLKIFLGAAPGVGKTWEMLVAANAKREAGVDVVAGFIETHGREGTAKEIGNLEVLPRSKIPYRGQTLEEFDLDAALKRRPKLYWSTNSPTPTPPACAMRNAGRTYRRSWRPASMSGPPSTSSIWKA